MNVCPQPMKETRPADHVISAFLSYRRVSHEDLITGMSSVRPLVRARQELMWLLRDLTFLTPTQIGQLLGGRDESTIRHGIDKVSDQIASDETFRREMLNQRRLILSAKPGAGLTPDLCLTAVRSVLTDAELSDTEARTAALQLMEARHGI